MRTNNYRKGHYQPITSQHTATGDLCCKQAESKKTKTINISMNIDAADSYLKITVNEYRAQPSRKQ